MSRIYYGTENKDFMTFSMIFEVFKIIKRLHGHALSNTTTGATYMLICSTLAPPLAKPQKPLKYLTLLYRHLDIIVHICPSLSIYLFLSISVHVCPFLAFLLKMQKWILTSPPLKSTQCRCMVKARKRELRRGLSLFLVNPVKSN
jgi:hypothetical protein